MKTPQRIFYLDDDTDDLYFFKEIAESLGHEVEIFINGTEMLRVLEKKIPDIIFLDVYMPVFDGDEILDVIKKNEAWNLIPVIMISGIFPKSNVGKYIDSGANYLMKKPVNFTELKTSIEDILGIDWKSFQPSEED